MILKQSTAATVVVGPVLDSAGAAVTTAVTANFSLSKNGTVAALTSETVTHSTNGYYTIALTSSNTDTLGRIEIIVNDSAMSMATHRYNVIVGASYDLLVTSGGYSTLDASGIRTAVGLAAANLDTQLSTIDTVVDNIEVDTQDIQSRLPAELVDGRMLSYADTLSEGFGDSLSSYLADDIASGNWDWPSAILVIQAGLSTLDAAGIRAAMGLAAANLDTQLSATNTNVDSAELNILDAVSSITVDNAAIASAVRSELAAELGRIDVDVSSRLAASAYTGSKVVVPVSALPFQVVRRYDNTAILRRFASFSWTLNNVGSLTGVQKIVFTIKDKRDSEADSASVLQIVASIPENAASDGVTYVNKESGSAVRTSGKITVQAYMDDFVERHRIVIEASDKVTALIDNYDNCTFDVKQIMADDSDILEEGILVIQGVSTRLISS